jgi:hypothetical protein
MEDAKNVICRKQDGILRISKTVIKAEGSADIVEHKRTEKASDILRPCIREGISWLFRVLPGAENLQNGPGTDRRIQLKIQCNQQMLKYRFLQNQDCL